jgi:hypothetical protein
MDFIVEKSMSVYISKKVIRNNGSRGRLLNRIVVAKIAMSKGAAHIRVKSHSRSTLTPAPGKNKTEPGYASKLYGLCSRTCSENKEVKSRRDYMAISACSLRSSASSSSSSSWAGALDLAGNSQYAKVTAVRGKE